MSRAISIEQQSTKLDQIRRITSLLELDGWEEEAKRHGMFPGEQAGIMARRVELHSRRK